MQAARDHLEELGREAAAAPGAALARFPLAHAAAARVLAGGEFRADAGPTWLDRQIARAQDALLRFFSGMGRVGARNPWLAPLLEWLCFGLAAAGLLFFLRRNLRRQALRLSLGQTAAVDGAAAALNTDWIRKADSAKAAGDWREAIHCLYWAAIAGLETRRAWRPNATRTPREYPRLLRPGSEAQRALHSLTRRFERTWYGTADSVPAEVQAARGELAAAMATFSVGEFGSTASGAARRSPAPAEGAGS